MGRRRGDAAAQQHNAGSCHEHDTQCHCQAGCAEEEAGTKEEKKKRSNRMGGQNLICVAAQHHHAHSHNATARQPVTADHMIGTTLVACRLKLVTTSFQLPSCYVTKEMTV